MRKIGELVSFNPTADIASGVQLNYYGDPQQTAENEKLATSYVFSKGREQDKRVSAIGLCEKIRDCLVQGDGRNVFTVIASYGHGKSHLALVLANYFGRTDGDPVLEGILQQIARCSDDKIAYHFRQFKKNAGRPQLVVRLVGTEFMDLQQGLLRALRRALDEHEATRSYALKTVAEAALTWLDSLSTEQQIKAETFLGDEYQTDLAALKEALGRFDIAQEPVVRALSKAVLGIEAAFGAGVSLRETLNCVVDDLCTGAAAPFHKLVILFDELGVYADKWCHNRIAAGGLAAQQILEACDDRRRQVCFVGFIQRPLAEFAKSAALEEDFQKWAGRIPQETTYTLEANLEQVIENALTKQAPAWGKFVSDNQIQFQPVLDAAWRLLPEYRRQTDAWNPDKFGRTVGIGCYPLHPLLTGLLCHLRFTQGSRTIIETARELLQQHAAEPAMRNGRLRWVLPIELVALFESRFEGQEERYDPYHQAVMRLDHNADKILYEVLQAIFLYGIGQLELGTQTHAKVLAQLCGRDLEEVAPVLKRLDEEHKIIRLSQESKTYQFERVGTGRLDVLRRVAQEIRGQPLPSLASSLKQMNYLPKPETEAVQFKSDFGLEGDEWQLTPVLLDAHALNAARLADIAEATTGCRGTVVYLVAADAGELDQARQAVPAVLDKLPVETVLAVAIPAAPAVGLEQNILSRRALLNWSSTKREHYGAAYHDALKDIERNLRESTKAYWDSGGVTFHVASRIANKLTPGAAQRLDRIVDGLFAEAFPQRPPARSNKTMRLNSTQGNAAVATLARQLLVNEVNFAALKTPEKNLLQNVLLGTESHKWGLLSGDYKIQEPRNPRVRTAWHIVSERVREDYSVAFRSLLNTLRASPFGYDDYVLTLLLAAWIGRHKYDLTFYGKLESPKATSRRLMLHEVQSKLETAKKFIDWLESGNVQVQHTGKQKRAAATEYLQRLQTVTDCTQVTEALAQAEEILASLPESDLQDDIRRQAKAVWQEIKEVGDWQAKVEAALSKTEKSGNVLYLLKCELEFPKLLTSRLSVDQKAYSAACEAVKSRLAGAVERETSQPLPKIEEYGKLRQDFADKKTSLHKAGREPLSQKYAAALVRIEQEYQTLKAQQGETVVLARLDGIQTDSSLAAARANEIEINGLLENELARASDHARRKATDKLQKIRARITELEAWRAQLPQRIAGCNDSQQAEALQHEIIERKKQFAGLPENESLAQPLAAIKQRHRHLQDLETIIKQANLLEEIATAHISLTVLREEAPELTPLIEAADSRLAAKQQKLEADETQRTQAWLSDFVGLDGREISVKEARKLLDKARRPAMRLGPDDERLLEQAQTQLRAVLERDAASRVVGSFLEITSPQKQAECLASLLEHCSFATLPPAYQEKVRHWLSGQGVAR